MRIARFSPKGDPAGAGKSGGAISYGVIENSKIFQITGSVFNDFKKTQNAFELSDVKVLAPVEPSKIIAIGLNYKDHARELNLPIPQEPILFMKAPTSIIAEKESIVYPSVVGQLDYEAELAIVIKKKAKDASKQKAQRIKR